MSASATMKEVLASHNMIHVATIDGDGLPCVRGVDFAAGDDQNTIYFMTSKASRKVEQIRKNPKVGFAVDRDWQGWEEISRCQYIKGTALASIVDSPDEMQKAMGLLVAKFPFLADLPGDPNDFVGIRLDLEKVLVTDNTIQFGHTEEVAF